MTNETRQELRRIQTGIVIHVIVTAILFYALHPALTRMLLGIGLIPVAYDSLFPSILLIGIEEFIAYAIFHVKTERNGRLLPIRQLWLYIITAVLTGTAIVTLYAAVIRPDNPLCPQIVGSQTAYAIMFLFEYVTRIRNMTEQKEPEK